MKNLQSVRRSVRALRGLRSMRSTIRGEHDVHPVQRFYPPASGFSYMSEMDRTTSFVIEKQTCRYELRAGCMPRKTLQNTVKNSVYVPALNKRG